MAEMQNFRLPKSLIVHLSPTLPSLVMHGIVDVSAKISPLVTLKSEWRRLKYQMDCKME